MKPRRYYRNDYGNTTPRYIREGLTVALWALPVLVIVALVLEYFGIGPK